MLGDSELNQESCHPCLKCQVSKNKKDIRKLQKKTLILQKEVNKLNDVVQVSGGTANLGEIDNPVDNLFTTNIVSTDYSSKGFNLDDVTASLTPSFDSFPKNWIIANWPISSLRTYHYNLNTPAWITWAVQNHIQVMIGITLDNYQNELDLLSSNYLAADQSLKRQYDLNIIAIAVGN